MKKIKEKIKEIKEKVEEWELIRLAPLVLVSVAVHLIFFVRGAYAMEPRRRESLTPSLGPFGAQASSSSTPSRSAESSLSIRRTTSGSFGRYSSPVQRFRPTPIMAIDQSTGTDSPRLSNLPEPVLQFIDVTPIEPVELDGPEIPTSPARLSWARNDLLHSSHRADPLHRGEIGHKMFLELQQKAFASEQAHNPDVFQAVESALNEAINQHVLDSNLMSEQEPKEIKNFRKKVLVYGLKLNLPDASFEKAVKAQIEQNKRAAQKARENEELYKRLERDTIISNNYLKSRGMNPADPVKREPVLERTASQKMIQVEIDKREQARKESFWRPKKFLAEKQEETVKELTADLKRRGRALVYGRKAANLSMTPSNPRDLQETVYMLYELGVISGSGSYIAPNSEPNTLKNKTILKNLIYQAGNREHLIDKLREIREKNTNKFSRLCEESYKDPKVFQEKAAEFLMRDQKEIKDLQTKGFGLLEAHRATRPVEVVDFGYGADIAEAFVKGEPVPQTGEKVDLYRLTYELQNLGVFPPSLPF